MLHYILVFIQILVNELFFKSELKSLQHTVRALIHLHYYLFTKKYAADLTE